MAANDHLSNGQFGPTYYHGSGRDAGPAVTGIPEWDNAGLFVSHDPQVAKLYGSNIERIDMAPDTKVQKFTGQPAKAVQNLRKAQAAGADVAEFHKPHDFIGHIILNSSKIVSRTPWQED